MDSTIRDAICAMDNETHAATVLAINYPFDFADDLYESVQAATRGTSNELEAIATRAISYETPTGQV